MGSNIVEDEGGVPLPLHVEGRFRGDPSKYEDIHELFWVIMIKPGTTMWGANEDPEVLDEGGFQGYASSLGFKEEEDMSHQLPVYYS